MDTTAGGSQGGSIFVGAAADALGRTVVASKITDTSYLVASVSPAGTVDWQAVVATPQPGSLVALCDIELAPSGRVTLCLNESRTVPGSPFPVARTLITQLDSGGAPLWTIDRPGSSGGIDLTPTGDVLALLSAAAPVLIRLDASGAVVASGAPQVTGGLFGLTYDPRTGGTLFIERIGTGAGNANLVATGSDLTEIWRAPLAGVDPFAKSRRSRSIPSQESPSWRRVFPPFPGSPRCRPTTPPATSSSRTSSRGLGAPTSRRRQCPASASQ